MNRCQESDCVPWTLPTGTSWCWACKIVAPISCSNTASNYRMHAFGTSRFHRKCPRHGRCGASRSGNRSGSSTPSASMQGQAMVYSTATTHLYSSPWLPCKVRLWLRHKERIPLQASSQISCTAQSSHRYRNADVVHSSSRTMILSVTSVTRHACRHSNKQSNKQSNAFLSALSITLAHSLMLCRSALCTTCP